MIPRTLMERSPHTYPVEGWRMVQRRFSRKRIGEDETVFALSNGYLGIRGTYEEGRPVHEFGTFVNGFFESWPIIYGEEAFGFAKNGQTIVNVTDGTTIKLYVDDEPFYLPNANLLEFERALDFRAGTLDRALKWETASGKVVEVRTRRLVSFRHRHLAAIRYEITVLNEAAPVLLSSELRTDSRNQPQDDDPRRARGFRGRVLQPGRHVAEDRRLILAHETTISGLALACGADHLVETTCPYESESRSEDNRAHLQLAVEAQPGKTITITKFLTYHTSSREGVGELCGRASHSLNRALAAGWDELVDEQRAVLDAFWETADIEFDGDLPFQRALRFNLFHLFQATVRVDGKGVPAKGLTGQGYEGHYFWDIEIYVLPFLIYTAPRIARNLLKVRYDQLPQARERAREVNQAGALFPWRTIDGEEASAYYAAGTAQYHINADVVYAMKKYVDVTGDLDFLLRFGAEILIETARLWVDLGFFSSQHEGAFCIFGVTGPDEYNTVVNNNLYTNLMARMNLHYAARALAWMNEEHPEAFDALAHRTALGADELERWQQAADAMYIPYDEELGIHPQDDAFLGRKPWDFENTPPEKLPLLLNYHPLVIYRHQVIKQADVVLALFLLGHEFTYEEKKRNFDFYDPLTTGDSSLSAAIQAICAAELGYRGPAREYVQYAALMDLADIGRNVADGVHIASMGGTWMAMVYGLAGLREGDGHLQFRPVRPKEGSACRFRLRILGCQLEVHLARDGVTYHLLEGDELAIQHEEATVRLTRHAPEARHPYADHRVQGSAK